MQALVTEARVLARQHGNDLGNLGLVLQAAGAIPSGSPVDASGAVRSPWGGRIRISASDLEGELPGTMIVIEFRGALDDQLNPIPREVCTRLVAYDGATGSGVLGDGIAFVEMTGAMTIGGILWAPSDRMVTAYPPRGGVGATNTVFGGLDPAAAGRNCKALDEHILGFRLMVGYWFEN